MIALSAIDAAGSVRFQLDRDEKTSRRRTIPVHSWWGLAVKRELEKLGEDQKQLAARINQEESAVSRCISGKVPVDEIIIAISDALKLPYPFMLPETEEIALHLATQHRLVRRDTQIGEIKAGVAGVTENKQQSQTSALSSEHAFRSRRKGKAVSRVRGG